jgi:hypothetical protein
MRTFLACVLPLCSVSLPARRAFELVAADRPCKEICLVETWRSRLPTLGNLFMLKPKGRELV